jgi:uncharacterized protein (TIGR01244 family)
MRLMKTSRLRRLIQHNLAGLLAILLIAPVQAADFPQTQDITGFGKVLSRSGAAFISGQPTAEGLARMPAAGVTAVITLRGDNEQPDIGYDEAAAASDLGLAYYSLPLSGDDSYSPAVLAQFIALYQEHDGKILLHCGSARRASFLWTAFLVKHQGMDLATAQQHAMAINLGKSPVAGLLGQDLELSYQPPAPANSDDATTTSPE